MSLLTDIHIAFGISFFRVLFAGILLFASSAFGQEIFAEGVAAPSVHLTDVSGKESSLADHKGKLVLLNFWATWCAPCVAEMPALERLHQALREKGFSVVGINADSEKNRAKVLKFIDENGIDFPMLFDPKLSAPKSFGVTGFPESFFINAEGKFLGFVDPDDGKKKIRVLSDRPWDSPEFKKRVEALLGAGK